MKMRLLLMLTVLVACGCSEERAAPIDSARTNPDANAALCLPAGQVDSNGAIRLRDELGLSSTTGSRVVEIKATLAYALEHCSVTSTKLDAEIVGGLYVLLGDRFFVAKNPVEAGAAYSESARLLERFDAPSLMWLAALEGAARAEVVQGRLEAATELAAKQTSLARAWVHEHGFLRSALVDALRFEAQLLEARGQSGAASELAREADDLEPEA
jgi:hypothetical protein